MFTPAEILGMVALAAVILGAGFLIQRLDSALVGGSDAETIDSPEDDEDVPAASESGTVVIHHRNGGTRRNRRHGR